MRLGDLLHDGEPEAGPALFRREENVEHGVLLAGGNAGAVVGHANLEFPRAAGRADLDGPVLPDRLMRVEDEVLDGLTELVGIDVCLGEVAGVVADNMDTVLLTGGLKELDDVIDRLVQPGPATFERLGLRKGQEVVDGLLEPRRLAMDARRLADKVGAVRAVTITELADSSLSVRFMAR